MKKPKPVIASVAADPNDTSVYPYISLEKLTGKPVRDVIGYVTTEFGDPVFKISRVLFDDGSTAQAEGEHDLPYLLIDGEKANETMDRIVDEEREEDL